MDIKAPTLLAKKKYKAGKINVKTGDIVKAGDVLMQVEAGKNNLQIKADAAGKITEILCEEGGEVLSEQVLMKMECEDAAAGKPKEAAAAKNSEKIKADLLIIGAGPGGYVAAIYAAKQGLDVAIAEGGELGGTCLNVGCIPTKALVKSSEIFQNVKRADEFGIVVDGSAKPDMEKIIEHKENVRGELVGGINHLLESNGVRLLRGQASFESNSRVKVQGETDYTVSAKHIIIASGSKISRINIPGIDLPVVMNSSEALSCTQLPNTITIIGGGVIGMEFACMYNNLGVRVQVVEFLDRIAAGLDSDISQSLSEYVRQQGVVIHTGSKVSEIQQAENGQAVVTYQDKNGQHILVSDRVLVAIGREPNLKGLQIENTDVKLKQNGRGIAVDEYMHTSAENIYAIGDVTDTVYLAHVASHQGIKAVDNIMGKKSAMDYSAVPSVIFTSPEAASVGMTEDECNKKNIEVKVSKAEYSANGKALTMGETEGYVKIIQDVKTQRIVGASIIGADASALIGVLTLAVSNGMTDKELTETIVAHPTTGEVVHEAAMGFGIGAIHQP